MTDDRDQTGREGAGEAEFAGGFNAVGIWVFDRVKREYLDGMMVMGSRGHPSSDACHLSSVQESVFMRDALFAGARSERGI